MIFHHPADLDQALKILAEFAPDAKLIAGGTDLLVSARQTGSGWPDHLIDISGLQEINQIVDSGDEIIIGAAVTHDTIVRHLSIKNHLSLLARACRQIGSQQIRNRGSIGGNICNASPCADSVTALVAMDAEAEICSVNEIRRVPLAELIVKPYQTILEHDEILTLIRIKKLPSNAGCAFIKLGRRNAVAISRINMAATMQINKSGIIKSVKLAPGSVFPVWRRMTHVEKELIGEPAGEKLFSEAGRMVVQEMIRVSGRRWSTPYKEPVVEALVKRVLLQAAGLDKPAESTTD